MNYQLKKYPKYKPSGVEWIGEIPEHWDVKKLKYEAKIQGGFAFKSEEFVDNGKPVIRIGDVSQTINLIECRKTIETNISEEYLVRKFDTLIALSGATVGKMCYINQDIDAYINQRVARVNNGTKFLHYILTSKFFVDQIILAAGGSAQENISTNTIGNFYIPIPPLSEQTAIANYLDDKTSKIDSLIEKKKKLIELYKEERTAVINQAVTLGINPNVKLKDSGIEWLGQISEHWEVKKLKYVAKVNYENLTEKEDEDLLIHYIDISSVDSDGNIISITEYNYSDAPSRARRRVKIGDTILSTVRTYLKAIAFIGEEKNNLICSTGFAVISPLDVFIPKFLFYIFRSQIIIEKIMAASKGVSYPAVDSEDVKCIFVWYPSKEEQLQIVQHIEEETKRIDDKIAKTEKEIELLLEYRTALISEVVTGKIKVIDN